MQHYTAVRATREYVPLQATTAATSAQHHSMCHPQCAVTTAAQVGGEGFWTQEFRVVVPAGTSCGKSARRHLLVRRKVVAASIRPRHTVSRGGSCVHASAPHLSVLDQLGAQPWQNPACEGALNVPCGDCSCLCLRLHCRCRCQRASGPQYQTLSR